MDAAAWIVRCAVGTCFWSCRGLLRYFVVMVTEMTVFGTLLYDGTRRLYLAWCPPMWVVTTAMESPAFNGTVNFVTPGALWTHRFIF